MSTNNVLSNITTTTGYITAMCVIPSVVDATRNIILVGTSTGKVYKYQPAIGVVPVGLGTEGSNFTSEIRAISTDPGGLYVFVGVPGNNALCRYRTTDIVVNNQVYSISGTSNSNIYTAGDNTGGIAVNSQGEVFFINQSGGTISYFGSYGYERVPNVQYSAVTPIFTPDFRSLQFQTDENKLFVADNKLGLVYYYDFVKDTGALTTYFQYPPFENPLSIYFDSNSNMFSALAADGLITVRTTGNNLFTPVAGGGTDAITTDPGKLKITTPRALVADNVGNLFFPSDISGANSSYLYNLSFEFVKRAGVTNYPPRQKSVNCGLPAPGNCKKPAPTFSPREYWGWGSPNRKFLTPDPNLGCTLTPYVACATILRLPPPPDPPPPPPVVITPVVPTETPTLQFSERRVSLAPIPEITSNVITICGDGLVGSGELLGAPAIGPLGEVYVGTSSGNLVKYGTRSDTYFPRLEWSDSLPGGPIIISPSVSRKGVIGAFAGNTLYSVNPSGAIMWSCNLPSMPAGSVAFDGPSMIAAYGRYITYFYSNGQAGWIDELQNPNEYFTVSPLIYASVIFVGTNLGTMYCFDREGNNLWGYNTANGFPITTSPVPLSQYSRLVFANGRTLYTINAQNPRKPQFDILCDISSITSIQSSPVAIMDVSGASTISRIFFTADDQKVYNVILSNQTIVEIKTSDDAIYEPTFSTSFSTPPKLIYAASLNNQPGFISQLNMDLGINAVIDLSSYYVNSESVLLAASRRLYALANSTDLCNGYLVTVYDDSPTFPPTNFVGRRPGIPPPPPAPPSGFGPNPFLPAISNAGSFVWTTADPSGGSPIIGYFVGVTPVLGPLNARAAIAPRTVYPNGLNTAITIPGLVPGARYQFFVYAKNEALAISSYEYYELSTPRVSRPCDPPNIRVQGLVTNTSIPISWASASPGGGSAISGYKISWETLNNMASGGQLNVGSNVLSTVLTGLSQDQEYYVLVQAINNDPPSGNLSPGNVTLVTKTATPNAPTDPYDIHLNAATTSNSVYLAWTAAQTNGGDAICNYNITWTPKDAGGTLDVSGDMTSAFISDLEPGSRYTFTMQAGTSSNLQVSPGYAKFSTVTVASNGLKDPTNFSIGAPATANSIGLGWTKPTPVPGVNTLSGYVITWQPPDGDGTSNIGNTRSAVISGLNSSTQYVFNIIAFGFDLSDESLVTSPGNFYVTAATTAEGGVRSPFGLAVDVDAGGVTSSNVSLMWKAAIAGTPGDFIKSYTITAYDTSDSYTLPAQTTPIAAGPPGADTAYTFTDLSAGREYLFSLVATSDLDLSAAGVNPETLLVTTVATGAPLDPPLAVVESGITATSVIIGWEAAGQNGGGAITRYTLTWETDGTLVGTKIINTPFPDPLQTPITGLTPGTTYVFNMVAKNGANKTSPGEQKLVVSTLELGGPADPGNFLANPAIPATPTTISVKWDSAFRNGGAAIANYTIHVTGPEYDNTFTAAVPQTSYTVSGLTPSTLYEMNITAMNSNKLESPGQGPVLLLSTDAEMGPAQPGFIDRAGTPPPDANSNIAVAWNNAYTDGGTDISGYQVIWSPVPIK